LDLLYIKISDSEGLDLKAWCLDAWMLAGLKGLEEVADRWEEGIGRTENSRTSHTLGALGGRRILCFPPLLRWRSCQYKMSLLCISEHCGVSSWQHKEFQLALPDQQGCVFF
jgi:hypothetical protein